jgi:hypothetical protein
MAPLFYPTLLGHGSTFVYINCKAGPKWKHDKRYFYFGEGSIFGLLCWGRAHVPKIVAIGQPNGSLQNEKNQKLVGKRVKISASGYPNGWVGTGSSRSKKMEPTQTQVHFWEPGRTRTRIFHQDFGIGVGIDPWF